MPQMNQSTIVTVTSSLSVFLFTVHMSDDIVRGFEPGGFRNASGILIAAVWLYGTLALHGRRSGYILMLLGSLLGCVVPLAHMRGAGLVGGRIASSTGVHLFVWTLIALGVTASLSAALSAGALWRLRPSNPRNR